MALTLMESNLDHKLTVAGLARSIQLSRSHLYYLFKREIGMSPKQYLKMLKMEKARGLLESSLLSVKEIAAKVGYDDDSHFMRGFKRTYGLTPSEHRARFLPDILADNFLKGKKFG